MSQKFIRKVMILKKCGERRRIMGLNYEMALYTELTGEDGTKVPIGQLGHFLWGYEIGVEKGRPKGKWIIERGCEEVIVVCSNCGAKDYIPTTTDGRFYFNRNYCWDCGADNRGEECRKKQEYVSIY